MKYFAFLTGFLLTVLPAYSGGVIEKISGKRVFILSIGFSADKFQYEQTATSYFQPCPTCITDASGMADYFKQLGKRQAPNVDTVIAYTYTSDITLDTLYNVFNNLQQQVTKNDIFIFYYASIAWHLQTDNEGDEEGNYAFNSKAVPSKSGNYYFTLRILKNLTDRIAALQQMIIFDTGVGDVILADYYGNFFNDNLTEALFSKKNRVILCPEKMSSESIDRKTKTKKGDIFKAISNLPDSFNILSVFDTTNANLRKTFFKHWYENQLDLMAYVKIIHETEYLKILSALQRKQGDGKRGLSILRKPLPADSNISTRKKKVLIIATGEYNAFTSWSPLKNPVNDGKDAANIFSSMGYEVKALYNESKDSILSAISDLVDNEVQNPYSQYIVYFAGHGYYDLRQKAGYIVCKDSKGFRYADRPTINELESYIDYTVLFRSLDQLNKVILITDVCFGGTSINSMLQFTRETDPAGEPNKMKNPFKKVLASGITEVDDFIRDRNGSVSANSPFAIAMFAVMKKQGNSLTFEELYGKLKGNQSLKPTPVESSFGTEKIPNSFTF